MKLIESDILPVAEKTGFRIEMIEKVLLLINLLSTLNTHPFLKGKWVLKGGTALNLFLLSLPRLSVDIDINYIGKLDREQMLAERPGIEQAVQAVFSREGFIIKRFPGEHAGGKWRLGYQSITGQPGNLEVDLNFMYRQPLFDISIVDSHPFGNFQAKKIPVLDLHEIVAGKLTALLSRGQARDLYDCYQILSMHDIKHDYLRIAFVVYGAMNRKDWRAISIEGIDFDASELARQLIPTLNIEIQKKNIPPAKFGEKLLDNCKKALSLVLPLKDTEVEFLNRLLGKGEIVPSILTSDKTLIRNIKNQPLLEWKALNVRQYKKN
jgi:predicted nucleotidyltransferase component of viral defense system